MSPHIIYKVSNFDLFVKGLLSESVNENQDIVFPR